MSSYGTSGDYCRGYDDGADETASLYDGLVAAAQGMVDAWGKEGNLSSRIQALDAALKGLKSRRMQLDETTYPNNEDDDDDDTEGNDIGC